MIFGLVQEIFRAMTYINIINSIVTQQNVTKIIFVRPVVCIEKFWLIKFYGGECHKHSFST